MARKIGISGRPMPKMPSPEPSAVEMPFVTAVRLRSHPNARRERLTLAGLRPEARYHVAELDVSLTGQELMKFGLPLAFEPGDDRSLRYTLKISIE